MAETQSSPNRAASGCTPHQLETLTHGLVGERPARAGPVGLGLAHAIEQLTGERRVDGRLPLRGYFQNRPQTARFV